MLLVISPHPKSHSVELIEARLSLPGIAVIVPCVPVDGAVLGHCFENVQAQVTQHMGQTVFGWNVWQHGDIFVEAEHHAVWQAPDGSLTCITPQNPPTPSITFIPNPSAIWDYQARLTTNNIRIALIQDSRLEQMFRLLERETVIINANRAVDSDELRLEGKDAIEWSRIQQQKPFLMQQVLQSRSQQMGGHLGKVGRNDPCPCGSGRKSKKCHGA